MNNALPLSSEKAKVGDRVCWSHNGTRSARDLYLNTGKPSTRSAYQQAYHAKMEARGTLTEIRRPTDGRAPFFIITWDDGGVSQSSTHLIALA
jgi:hypothetical protein